MAMAGAFLQNTKPGHGRDQRRQSSLERRTGQTGASRPYRRLIEPVVAGDGGGIRSTGAALEAWTGHRGTGVFCRDAGERGAACDAARTAAPGASFQAAARHAAGQARPPPAAAAAARPTEILTGSHFRVQTSAAPARGTSTQLKNSTLGR